MSYSSPESVVTVSVLTTSLLLVTRQISRSQAQVVDRNRAFYLAEAGLAEAFAGLAIGKTGNVGTWDEPAAFGDGLFVAVGGEDAARILVSDDGRAWHSSDWESTRTRTKRSPWSEASDTAPPTSPAAIRRTPRRA